MQALSGSKLAIKCTLVSDRFKYILADGHAHCVLLDNRYTLVDSSAEDGRT